MLLLFPLWGLELGGHFITSFSTQVMVKFRIRKRVHFVMCTEVGMHLVTSISGQNRSHEIWDNTPSRKSRRFHF